MHMPIEQSQRKRVGLTGDIRFRKQRFTGKMVLQVAVIYEVKKWRYPRDLDRTDLPTTTEVEWEDADASAALRVATGSDPFERKRVKAARFRPSEAPMWGTCHGHGDKPCEHNWVRHICHDIHQEDYFVCDKCGAQQ